MTSEVIDAVRPRRFCWSGHIHAPSGAAEGATMTTTHSDLVDRYVAMWNEPDPTRRAHLVADLWTDDAAYTDPLADVRGREAINGLVGAVQEQFAGHTFRPYGRVDGHHDVVRFGWGLVPDGGDEPLVIGFDVAVTADDGRIRAVHGFLDRAPTP
jgi:hypothetical protein